MCSLYIVVAHGTFWKCCRKYVDQQLNLFSNEVSLGFFDKGVMMYFPIQQGFLLSTAVLKTFLKSANKFSNSCKNLTLYVK